MRHKDPERMQNILEYITEYYIKRGRTPSTTKIAEAMGIARSTAYKYLVAMDERGMLEYRNGELVTKAMNKISTSLEPVDALGSIACGDPTA